MCSLTFYNAYSGFQLKNKPFDGSGPFGSNIFKNLARYTSNQISKICNGLLVEINKRWARSYPPEVTEQDMSHEIKIFSIFEPLIEFRSFAIYLGKCDTNKGVSGLTKKAICNQSICDFSPFVLPIKAKYKISE